MDRQDQPDQETRTENRAAILAKPSPHAWLSRRPARADPWRPLRPPPHVPLGGPPARGRKGKGALAPLPELGHCEQIGPNPIAVREFPASPRMVSNFQPASEFMEGF